MKLIDIIRLVAGCLGPSALIAVACSGPPASDANHDGQAGADQAGAGQPLDPSFDGLRGELPPGPISVMSHGADTSLCMSWEPTIAVDPNNPRTVAVSQFNAILVSFDGGDTFPVTVSAPGANLGGDPSLAFDDQGQLFLTYLCSPGTGRDVCISGFTCNAAAATCNLSPGTTWPVNVAIAAGIGGNNADKEWLAADSSSASPFPGRLYVVWTRLDTAVWSLWATWSDDAVNWSAAQQISAADEGPAWPSHVAVGPGGAVFAAWHAQTGFFDAPGNDSPNGTTGQIVLRRSDDGGVSWQPRSFPYGPGDADMTYNVQHETNGVIPGANMWLQGSLQPWILPDPQNAARVFVVVNDDPDNDVDMGDAADVFIVESTDSGGTWAARRRVDQGPAGTFQVMPTAAINPVNGAIGVTYYDNRGGDADGDGVDELDLWATFSTDGGQTWSMEVDINDGRMDPAQANTCRFCGSDAIVNQTCGTMACPAPGTTRIGEYNGVAFGECTLHAVWADNATAVCGGDFDTFYDRDPALGGDMTAPAVVCPADALLGCTDSTDPSSTGTATATDACDVNPAVTFSDVVAAGNCPVTKIIETITRTWEATDEAGNSATCEQEIAVSDDDPPVVTAPAPIALECNAADGVPATDPAIVAWLALATAVDECSAATLENDAPALFPYGCPPAGQTTTVTFTGTDQCANSATDDSTVTVVDTTAPTVSCSVATSELWAPYHGFVDVGFSFTTGDVCDPDLDIAITVTSDEPAIAHGDGGPIHCPDAIVGADGSVQLRVERSGLLDGRVYRITVTATDACGNSTPCSATVSVPKSLGPDGTAVDSGQAFDATVCN